MTWLAGSAAAQSPNQPLLDAAAELKSAKADIGRGHILALQPHVEALERMLAENFIPKSVDGIGVITVDGPIETLIVAAALEKSHVKAQVMDSPYPQIGLYLGSYYNEAGKPEDALRVLDLGIKQEGEGDLGQTLPLLYNEKSIAHAALKQWDKALADSDDGLKISTLGELDKARLMRRRGYALVELRKLDDAEAAYKESLQMEPNNPVALSELENIAKIRAGELGAAPRQFLVRPPPTRAEKPI